jgi:TetR/AcrR family transcriptional repressor of nem operon
MPMAALPTYVAGSSKDVKRAFESVFKAMIRVLERSLVDKEGPIHATAQSIAALCVGGMVVARSVVDGAVAEELRNACMAIALKLGGWDNVTNSKRQPLRRRRDEQN